LDYLSKSLALKYLSEKPVKLLGSFLQFHLASNSGAAFNIASGKTIFLTLFGFFVVLALLWWATRITSLAWAVALGLVIGGIIGNEIDRIFRATPPLAPLQGRVIDWIELPHWPIFNLADTSIVLGAGLIVILNMRGIKAVTHDGRA